MKLPFFWLFAATAIGARCGKKDSTQEQTTRQQAAFSDFKGKLLICDSAKTIRTGVTTSILAGQGTGLDMRFDSQTYTVFYSSPIVMNYYEFEAPDKIYYWPPSYTKDPKVFFTIALSGKNMVQSEHDEYSPLTIIKYFHYN